MSTIPRGFKRFPDVPPPRVGDLMIITMPGSRQTFVCTYSSGDLCNYLCASVGLPGSNSGEGRKQASTPWSSWVTGDTTRCVIVRAGSKIYDEVIP